MFIYTSSQNSQYAALDELKTLLPGARLDRWIAPGVGLIDTKQDWGQVAARFHEQPPLFIRHICPVVGRVLTPSDLSHFETPLTDALLDLDTELSFSVQTRLFGDESRQFTRFDLNNHLARIVESWGAALDVRSPGQIVSVVVTPAEGFVGISRAWDNLSDWAGGARRFKKDEGQISRAEFKLLEALELFGIEIPKAGLALDLGAAPGGWSRILADRGLQVVAVDPAKLDPRISRRREVAYVGKTIQYYNPGGKRFDVILNDMRMDARDSARLMLETAAWFTPGGVAVMTLKLPEDRMAKTADKALGILREKFTIKGARQLFHNRNELTVALEPRI